MKLRTILFGGRAFKLEPVYRSSAAIESELIGYQVYEYLTFASVDTCDDLELFRSWFQKLRKPCGEDTPQAEGERRGREI